MMRPPTDTAVVTHATLQELAGLVTDKEFSSVPSEVFVVPACQLRKLLHSDRSAFHFLYARHLLIRGEYLRAHARIRCAIRLCRAGSDHVLFARAKHVSGMICRHLGRLDEAAEQFLEAYVSHKRARNNEAACLPLISLGLLHIYAGDLRQARKVMSDALSFAKRFCSNARVNDCAYNLSIVNMLSGHFAECRTLLDLVRSQPLSMIDDAYRTRYSGQLAVWLLAIEDAREQIKRAMVVFAREHIQRDYVVCLEYLGLNEYFAGNYQKAKEYYEQVLAMPEPTASAVAQTLRMLADVYIAEKDWKRAKETATKAEAAITKINERIELGALWRAQAQIAAHDGDATAARALLEKSLDLLQQCGARYELALSHFCAGQADCFDRSQQDEHLAKARAFFVEMDVPKRVTQIDAAIAAKKTRVIVPTTSIESESEQRLIITRSPKLRSILDEVEHTKDSDLTVLITGETGTGKDLLAEYIHRSSKRAKGPYINENVAAIPQSMMEAELFGFNRGAFTNALESKPGMIEAANGGTFCFNEIGELPPAMQVKLLRVLETKTVRRLGEVRDRRFDIRFIAITNRDLRELVKQNLFREDLYQRLRQLVFHLPALRERAEDIPLLFEYFAERFGASLDKIESPLYQELLTCLCQRRWKGNIRELYNFSKSLATRNSNLTSSYVRELIIFLRKKR